MKKVLYHLVRAFIYLCSLLPLWVHYVLSDGIYLIIYHVIGYRKALVKKNLADSFPGKSPAELLKIERQFYHWFCDYLVESIKLVSMSERQMKKRMVFKGTGLVDQLVGQGQSCAVFLGHYCNWEWITSLPLWITTEAQCGQIYHVLENPLFDRLFLQLRQRFGAVCIPMAETPRRLIKYRQMGRQVVIGYISDQTPFWNNIHHWTNFLNHDTPVLTGTERLARKTGHAVFYMDVSRPRRGYYEAEFKLITRNPREVPEFDITDTYFRMLEATINRAPQYWLWTHNRWKRTHEEFNLRYDERTGRVDIVSTIDELRKKKG